MTQEAGAWSWPLTSI